jgi:hypothetical protein
MRIRFWVLLAAAFAVGACNDAPAPTALNSTSDDPAVGPEAHFSGGPAFSAPKSEPVKAGKSDQCDDDRDRQHRHPHLPHLFRRGRDYYFWDRHHHLVKWDPRHPADSDDCAPSSGGSDPSGSVAGTVMNNGAGANGFPVFLLSTDGATVVASGATGSDGTGTFSVAGVKAGTYLLCETNPFTDQWGMLGETRPNSGPSCPAAYAPIGFSVTVTAGATADGNAFTNFGLD